VRIGDLVESNNGCRGIITEVEMMYPRHPQSPVGRVAVDWIGAAPRWYRKGLMFSPFSVKVISRANR
jgi:hypothetical protein